MKKKIGIVLALVLGVSALGLGMLQSSASEASPELEEQEIRDLITSQYPGKITELEMEQKGNRSVYEAEIQDDGTEYDIKLDGNTGDVLELDKTFAAKDSNEQSSSKNNAETSDETDSNQNNAKATDEKGDNAADAGNKNRSDEDDKERVELSQNENSENNGHSTVISMEEALEIARNEFSGMVTEVELDEDDGHLYYGVDMITENKEAEVEIDAYTGDILVVEIDD